MTVQELAAASLHELGHVRQGLGKVVFLRGLSTVGGFPPWFLLLLLNFRAMEEDADQFALRAGASPSALASAIVKATSVQVEGLSQTADLMERLRDHVPQWALGPCASAVKTIQVLDRFLFEDELIGLSHPPPRDRIATVLGRGGMRPDTRGG